MSNDNLKKAKEDLQKFLEKNPDLIQEQILLEAKLATITDPKDRLDYIASKMRANMKEISRLTAKIENDIAEVQKKFKND